MAANLNMYKKSALTLMHMARDLFLTETGERIPTIHEYTEKFSVSRGVVQASLETLTNEGCITMEKRGVKGSFLVSADYKKLYSHTGWGAVTGTMPVPMNPYLTSLATAVCEELAAAPMTFSFAYMSGSEKRVEALRNGVYDFLILSRSAARLHMAAHEELEICTELTGSVYSLEYVLYFMDPTKSTIEDGMRVGVDPVCLDQRVLTEMLCEGKQIELVEFPFIGFEDLARGGKVDCVVYRRIGWRVDAEKVTGFHMVSIEGAEGFDAEDTNTPVVLIRKENYGIDRLLKKYLGAPRIRQIQEQVLSGNRSMKFY